MNVLVRNRKVMVRNRKVVVGPCAPCCGECGTLCCAGGARPWGWPVVAGSCGATNCQYRLRMTYAASGFLSVAEALAPCGASPVFGALPFSFSRTVEQLVTAPIGGGIGCTDFNFTEKQTATNAEAELNIGLRGPFSQILFLPAGNPGNYGWAGAIQPNTFLMWAVIRGSSFLFPGAPVLGFSIAVDLQDTKVPVPGWGAALTPITAAPLAVTNRTPGTVTRGPLVAGGFRKDFSAGGWSISQSLGGQCGFAYSLSVGSLAASFEIIRCCGAGGTLGVLGP